MEREFVEIKKREEMWLLKEILEIKENECFYCQEPIKKGDKFSIFNKPQRLICRSIVCLSEAVEE